MKFALSCLLAVFLVGCSRLGVVERWELPIERVRVRRADCSFLVTVSKKDGPQDFYIEHRKIDNYEPGLLLEEADPPWETGRIEYINRTHDVGHSSEGTNEEYTIRIERTVPPGANTYYVWPAFQSSCITLPDRAGRFIDASTLPDLHEFVDVKVARWTTLKYVKSREGHTYLKLTP